MFYFLPDSYPYEFPSQSSDHITRYDSIAQLTNSAPLNMLKLRLRLCT